MAVEEIKESPGQEHSGRIIVVRHGKKDEYGALTEQGIRECELLADRLQLFVGGSPVRILHSPVPRVTKSAQVLAQVLGVNELLPERHLESIATTPQVRILAKSLIDHAAQGGVQIAVTHMDVAAALRLWICRAVVSSTCADYLEPNYASGVVIDPTARSVQEISYAD